MSKKSELFNDLFEKVYEAVSLITHKAASSILSESQEPVDALLIAANSTLGAAVCMSKIIKSDGHEDEALKFALLLLGRLSYANDECSGVNYDILKVKEAADDYEKLYGKKAHNIIHPSIAIAISNEAALADATARRTMDGKVVQFPASRH